MAKKKNEFTEDWITFHDIAVDLSHLLCFLPWQLKMARTATDRSLKIVERQGLKGHFGAATGLTVIDVFRNRRDEYVYRAPAGKRTTQGDDILTMLADVEGRFNNSALITLHEAMEVYVKKLFARMLYQLRSQKPLKDKKAFHAALSIPPKHEGTPEYFTQYVAWACKRNCRKAFAAFESQLDWSLLQQEEWRGISWISVADLLSLCRNCIVHDEGRVAHGKWNEMTRPQQALVRSCMRESVLTGNKHILFDKEGAYQLLEAIVTLAYLLYVLLSNRFDMNIDHKLGAIEFQ